MFVHLYQLLTPALCDETKGKLWNTSELSETVEDRCDAPGARDSSHGSRIHKRDMITNRSWSKGLAILHIQDLQKVQLIKNSAINIVGNTFINIKRHLFNNITSPLGASKRKRTPLRLFCFPIVPEPIHLQLGASHPCKYSVGLCHCLITL